MILLYYKQRSIEWDWARISRLTGSEIYKIIAETRAQKKSAEKYINSKVQGLFLETLPDKVFSKPTQWGTDHEPDAIFHYFMKMNEDALEWEHDRCLLIDKNTPFLSSPEPFNIKKKKATEFKCPITIDNFAETYNLKTPKDLLAYKKEYFWQCISTLVVTECDSIDFVNYHPYMKYDYRMNILTIKREDVKEYINKFNERLIWAADIYFKTYENRKL